MSESTRLDKVRRVREKDIIEQGLEGGGETFSTLSEYAPALGYLTEDELTHEISGKRVLDLGSGLGGLVKDVFRQGIDCEVVSLNPRFSRRTFREGEKLSTRDFVTTTFPRPSKLKKLFNSITGEPNKDTAEETQFAHNKGAVAGFGHALPFANDSFDLVMDKDAVSKHASPQDYDYLDKATPVEKELFKNAVLEMVRVVKPGGKIKISDIFGYGYENSWKEQILRELGLDYSVIWEDLEGRYFTLWPSGKQPIGIEISKL